MDVRTFVYIPFEPMTPSNLQNTLTGLVVYIEKKYETKVQPFDFSLSPAL